MAAKKLPLLDEDAADEAYAKLRRLTNMRNRAMAFMEASPAVRNSRMKIVSFRQFDRLAGKNGEFVNSVDYEDPLEALPKKKLGVKTPASREAGDYNRIDFGSAVPAV